MHCYALSGFDERVPQTGEDDEAFVIDDIEVPCVYVWTNDIYMLERFFDLSFHELPSAAGFVWEREETADCILQIDWLHLGTQSHEEHYKISILFLVSADGNACSLARIHNSCFVHGFADFLLVRGSQGHILIPRKSDLSLSSLQAIRETLVSKRVL